MGKFITSSGLDIDKINAAFGSRDKKILAAVKKARTFFDYDDMADAATEFSVFDAVDDFVFVKAHDAPDVVYCCGLLLLCDAFKIALPYAQRIQIGEHVDLINKYLAEDFAVPETAKFERLVFSSDCRNTFKKALVIPPSFARFSEDDYTDCLNSPMIALWSCARVQDARQIFGRVSITKKDIKTILKGKSLDDKLKGAAYRTIMEFTANIDYCAARNLGMIHASY
jgi:hypothetical protein